MFFKKLAFAIASLVLTSLPALAQTPAGSITGRVADATGLPLPGVTVTVQGTDMHRTFTTDGEGRFRFLELAPGDYRLTTALRRFHDQRPRTPRHRRRPERRASGDARDRRGDRDRQRDRGISDGRRQADRHGDQRHPRRVDQHSDLARSVLAAAIGQRRAGGPRQRRRQRNRPAIQLRLQRHAAAGRGVDAGRRGHHRHDADRLVADLFQLGQLRGDSRRHRGPGDHPAVRRPGLELRRQARHQPVSRRRPLVLRQRLDGSIERSGGARRQGRDPGDRGSQQADLRLRLRNRRTAGPRHGLVLRLVLDPGRAAGAAHRHAGRPHAAAESEPEAELAGEREGHGQLPVFRRLQDQGQPEPGHVGHHLRRADRDVPPGQRLQLQPAARPVQARRRSRHAPEPVPHREVRLLQHRLRADPGRRHGPVVGPRPDRRAFVRIDGAELERASADDRQRRPQLVPERPGCVARREVRPRLAAGERHDRHAVAGQRDPRCRPDADHRHRSGVPRRQRHQSDAVRGRLPRRHHLQGSRDDRPRHSLRPSGRPRPGERHRGQPGVPGTGARTQLRGLRRAVHLEQPLAARRLHLRARRRAQDHRARQLRPLRRPARLGQRRLHEPQLVGRRRGLSLERSERRSPAVGG